MHIKQSADDFEVEELTDLEVKPDGPFSLYRLEKRGWTTPDALQVIRRRWQLIPRRLSYGGLKDRHAHTTQFLTIFQGPQRQLNQQDIKVTYLGQTTEPFRSEHIRANRFRLIIRDLTESEQRQAILALEEVKAVGIPNYFDDQRFGSVSSKGRFIAWHLIQDEFEEALKLALTASYAYDRAAQKKEKMLLRKYWQQWAACKSALSQGPTRNIVSYLVNHPNDFRGAFERIRPELRGLYLSAYQSHLWNRMLARWLIDKVGDDQLLSIPLRLGSVPMPRTMTDAQRESLATSTLPLPSARIKLEADDPCLALMQNVLAEDELELSEMRVQGLKSMFFSKGNRACFVTPSLLEGESSRDELHPGRYKLELRFDLTRGSYATLLIKRITRLEVLDSLEL